MDTLEYTKKIIAPLVLAIALSACQTITLPEFFQTDNTAGQSPAPRESRTQVTIDVPVSIESSAKTLPEKIEKNRPLTQRQRRLMQLLTGEAADSAGKELDIAFIEATSKTMLRQGQIDFAVSIDLDLPVNALKWTFEDLLAAPTDQGPRYVFILDAALAKASRRVLSLDQVESTVFIGFQGAPYSLDQDDPVVSGGYARNAPVNGAPFTSAAQNYDIKPSPMGAPIILGYRFDKAKIQVRKVASVNTYILDRRQGTFTKSVFDASEEQRFEVPYRLSRYDPKRKQHSGNMDSERDVDEFEKEPILVKISSLLTDYKNKSNKKQTYKNPIELRRLILGNQNRVLGRMEANRFDARPLNDPRFDSVVAIFTGKRTLGSGFFITPDVVMTNWHVVDNNRFVEMKTYDGRETFGTVLGKDVRLDVALVRVQNRGRPVSFYVGRNLNIGAAAEAIGHPKGFEFSITRGIVSAIRNHSSINLPTNAGKKVLYIQTDAPINPGNSGGPLFLGNRVIGMNTWGANKALAEGLNFSVHYSELMNFLNEHLPGYSVSPAGGN